MVVSWSLSKPKTDRDPHGNLTKVDKEEVATSRISFLSRAGSPPEKSLRRGQRTDKKLVEGEGPSAFSEYCRGSCCSGSVDSARSLLVFLEQSSLELPQPEKGEKLDGRGEILRGDSRDEGESRRKDREYVTVIAAIEEVHAKDISSEDTYGARRLCFPARFYIPLSKERQVKPNRAHKSPDQAARAPAPVKLRWSELAGFLQWTKSDGL